MPPLWRYLFPILAVKTKTGFSPTVRGSSRLLTTHASVWAAEESRRWQQMQARYTDQFGWPERNPSQKEEQRSRGRRGCTPMPKCRPEVLLQHPSRGQPSQALGRLGWCTYMTDDWGEMTTVIPHWSWSYSKLERSVLVTGANQPEVTRGTVQWESNNNGQKAQCILRKVLMEKCGSKKSGFTNQCLSS